MMAEAAAKHFVVDNMLGKLAKWLRILGFDTHYKRLHSREQVDSYGKQGFILITRSPKWSDQTRVFCLTANSPMAQIRELIAMGLLIPKEIRFLQRCVRCNEELRRADREEVLGQVPDYVFATYDSFYRCPSCLRIYWPGSHPERMIQQLKQQMGWAMANGNADTDS
jgi:uncharacterized protein